MSTNANREAWAHSFLAAARPIFADAGYPLPDAIRVGVGWTSKGARAKAIGECYATQCSQDGTWEIILSPALADASRVADVLTHELIHAAVGLECGHKGPFLAAMRKLGLEGKATATVAGEAWHEWADPILIVLGDYPHATLDAAQSSGPKKQATRMLKAECNVRGEDGAPCGYSARLTRKWLALGEPICPVHFVPMVCEDMGGEDEGE